MPVMSIWFSDTRPLEPQDILTLAVLGTADAGPASIADMQGVMRQLALGDWQPTTDVLQATVARAAAAGLLSEAPPADAAEAAGFATTEEGRRVIRQLLRRAIPRTPGGVTRLCMSVKLCLLHHLGPYERRSHIAELAAMYHQNLELFRQMHGEAGSPTFPTQSWLRHQVERLESELAWLESLQTWLAYPQAAE